MTVNDAYSVLGLGENASLKDVQKAYYKLAKKYHPDRYFTYSEKNWAEKKFITIHEAYDLLSDYLKNVVKSKTLDDDDIYRRRYTGVEYVIIKEEEKVFQDDGKYDFRFLGEKLGICFWPVMLLALISSPFTLLPAFVATKVLDAYLARLGIDRRKADALPGSGRLALLFTELMPAGIIVLLWSVIIRVWHADFSLFYLVAFVCGNLMLLIFIVSESLTCEMHLFYNSFLGPRNHLLLQLSRYILTICNYLLNRGVYLK